MIPAVIIALLSVWGGASAIDQWRYAAGAGQIAATLTQAAYGVFGVLVAAAAVWRSRLLGTFLWLWALSVVATSALAPVVWGGTGWTTGLWAALSGVVFVALLAWWTVAAVARTPITPGGAMNPELHDLLRQLEAIKADGRAVCAGLSEAQFNWRPGEGRWSVAECLVHLNRSVTATLPAFDRAITEGRAKGRVAKGSSSWRYGWFSRWMIKSMEPPPKRRMKTFPIFAVPVGGTHAVATVLPEFLAVRDQLAERVRSAEGLDLQGNRTVSPVTRLLRMPLGAYLQFVVTHDRRHLWQAHQVRTTPGFGTA